MKSIVMLCVIMSVACGVGSGVARGAALSDDAKKAALAANQFGWDLYHRLCTEQKGNVLLSPYSIDTALAMTCSGARGLTFQQMAKTLHFDQGVDGQGELIAAINAEQSADPKKAFALLVASALWEQKGIFINPGFQKAVTDYYAAGLRQVDFSGGPAALDDARQTINAWIAQQTHDKIKDLLAKGSLDKNTQLLLTNAIYFKSVWMDPFDKKATHEEPFHAPGADVNVPMMHQTHEFGYTETDGVQVLALPYQNNLLTMVLVLPPKTNGHARPVGDRVMVLMQEAELFEMEKMLDAKKLDQWMAAMKARDVVVSLPRFTFSAHFSLAKTLQAMGMTEAFGDKADFSVMCENPAADEDLLPGSLRISDVVHQAFIDVDEEQAAAATAVIMPVPQAPVPASRPPVVFNADHPFVFLIRDNASGAILFVGRVMNPKE